MILLNPLPIRLGILALLMGSCSLTPGDVGRLSLRPGIATTKYHLRQDGPGAVGSDFFPWDIDSLQSNPVGELRAEFQLPENPWIQVLGGGYSKVDAEQSVVLDPSRTWIWNGDSISTFEGSASFERMDLAAQGSVSLTETIHLRYGARLRRYRFDGDIFTDANSESFNFDALWLSPEIGLTAFLPWDLRADVVYSGFHLGDLALGDQVLRPYGAVGELRRDFGRIDVAAGYELDHVELERPLGTAVEFAHLRVRTVYLVLDLEF